MSHDEESPPTNMDDYDPNAETANSDPLETSKISLLVPQSIGRYGIERHLGSGGFGTVYLARDAQLDRLVAVKVPHSRLMVRPSDAEAYLAEARLVANLDHPHIVPVFDVGTSDEFGLYIVSKYIQGETLAHRMRHSSLDPHEIASLLAKISGALHYAHTRGIVHRDVKPGNLLIDSEGNPFVVDFGLALKESDIGVGPRYVGTPAYMSPEQARGEGHRVDGRSDIHAVGVVLYELLTGKRAFNAASRAELLEQVATREVRPPRQLDDSIPRELERICLKATAKRASDRYTTAKDLADDLRYFCAVAHSVSIESGGGGSTPSSADKSVTTGDDTVRPDSGTPEGESSGGPIRVIPKGLRSFDEQDADFFLKLLPGPRDRQGLPESIRFWKKAIERTDPDQTFRVGLLYGPSGCGKSSLVKAGLLPHLSGSVSAMYVEATAEGTEERILRHLEKQSALVDPKPSLSEAFAALRRGEVGGEKKWLLIIDQFEQWLHANPEYHAAELVRALRQCDGGRVQCLVMVRDDFWMAVTRFMRALEVPLLEGENSAPVDLFPKRHAERVLTAFGRAYDVLPAESAQLSREQHSFIVSSVAGLAVDDKVVCVRLALFAEMMKNKRWTPATLRELGGTEGVGITFLEETFHGPTAPPEHRIHEAAARKVLYELLPNAGTEIRGRMKSYFDLMRVSGYSDRAEFDELLHLLDSEIRLITPTDPEAARCDLSSRALPADDALEEAAKSGEPCYQLTHDYLVPSLRGWLTRRQRETVSGRAALRLRERASLWNWKRENRNLPSVLEYMNILIFTSRRQWDDVERRMMKQASRIHGFRASAGCLFLVAAIVGGFIVQRKMERSRGRAEARSTISQLITADVALLPEIVAEVDEHPERYRRLLQDVAADRHRPLGERIRANYAMANQAGDPASRLLETAFEVDVSTLSAIRDRIAPFAAAMADQIWTKAFEPNNPASKDLRAAALLAIADPHDDNWSVFVPEVVQALTSDEAVQVDRWMTLLQPVSDRLVPWLQSRLVDSAVTETERVRAARLLANYADGDRLSELLLVADASPFTELFPASLQHRDRVVQAALVALNSESPGIADKVQALEHARKLRNAAVILLRLGRHEAVESLLSVQPDPTARSMLLLQMRDLGVKYTTLLATLDQWQDPIARQALLLSFAPYLDGELQGTSAESLLAELMERVGSSRHQSERSALLWLCRTEGRSRLVGSMIEGLTARTEGTAFPSEDRDWYVTTEGQLMTRLDPRDDRFRVAALADASEPMDQIGVSRPFAISIHEVTMEQFERFLPDVEFATDVALEATCPANKIGFLEAMRYCRWLSEQESVEESEMCYPPIDEITAADAALSAERLARSGYRLPTEKEWELACRAGSETDWFSGVSQEYLRVFAWYAVTGKGMIWPVGTVRPNPFGLFDMAGNVAEWCHSLSAETRHIVRGGKYNEPARGLRSGRRIDQSMNGYSFNGFRIVRTLPENP